MEPIVSDTLTRLVIMHMLLYSKVGKWGSSVSPCLEYCRIVCLILCCIQQSHPSSISPDRQGKYTTTLFGLLGSTSTMFSSFSSFSNPFSVPRFLGGNPGTVIDLKSVDIHHVETQHEKRARTLKHLLKLNHANHSIVYHHLQFHNHMPHVRASLLTYMLMAELIQKIRYSDLPTS